MQVRDHAKTYMKFKKRNRLQRGAGGSDAQIILFTFLNFIYKTVTFNFQMTVSRGGKTLMINIHEFCLNPDTFCDLLILSEDINTVDTEHSYIGKNIMILV